MDGGVGQEEGVDDVPHAPPHAHVAADDDELGEADVEGEPHRLVRLQRITSEWSVSVRLFVGGFRIVKLCCRCTDK